MTRPSFIRVDSPWLWGVLFAIVGVCGVMIIAPKYAERRDRLDKQFQGRQTAMQNTSEEALANADRDPNKDQQNAQQAVTGTPAVSPLLLLGVATVAGAALLTGFAVYVFRGGHLQPTLQIASRSDDSQAENSGVPDQLAMPEKQPTPEP